MAAVDANSNLRSNNGSGIEIKEALLENLHLAVIEHGQVHHTSRRNTKSKKSTKSKKAKGSKSKKSEVANTVDTTNPISSRTDKIQIEEEMQIEIETAAPTLAPSTSASPSSSPSSSPTLVFDLGNCETYDYYWKKDLYNTCGSDWSTCECKGASWRIEKGDIDCATATCPKNCDVCYFCLMEVNNCISF